MTLRVCRRRGLHNWHIEGVCWEGCSGLVCSRGRLAIRGIDDSEDGIRSSDAPSDTTDHGVIFGKRTGKSRKQRHSTSFLEIYYFNRPPAVWDTTAHSETAFSPSRKCEERDDGRDKESERAWFRNESGDSVAAEAGDGEICIGTVISQIRCGVSCPCASIVMPHREVVRRMTCSDTHRKVDRSSRRVTVARNGELPTGKDGLSFGRCCKRAVDQIDQRRRRRNLGLLHGRRKQHGSRSATVRDHPEWHLCRP